LPIPHQARRARWRSRPAWRDSTRGQPPEDSPELLPKLEVLAREPPRVEGTTDDDPDLLHPKRLGEGVGRAGADGPDLRLDRREGCENDDRQDGLDGGQLLEDTEPVEVWHAEVDQRHIERLGRRQAHALFAARGETHPVALAAERLGQQLARDLI